MDFEDIDTIAVLGAGTMGHGIAELAALSGYEVTLRDINEEFVQDGYDSIEWSLNKLADSDHITDQKAEDTLARITPLVNLEDAVGEADVVIEAVPEKMEIKEDVYSDVEAYAPDHAIFATNTSSLSITDLSEITDRPEQFCGMHFFNPPVRMQLVEIISGDHTSDETLDVVEQLAESMDKTPVRVRKDSPGFIVNRILIPMINEACWLVDHDEATVAEVDSTATTNLGLPMGALELSDQVGNDVTLDILEYLTEVLGEAYEPCPLLVEMVEEEKLGKKSDAGFYDYDDGGAEIPPDQGREDVEHRLLAAMANEVAKLLADDVAPVDDVDTAMKLGAGFPKGPAKLADEAGLDTLLETLDAAHEQYGGARYEAAEYLREAADEGGFRGSESDDVSFDVINVTVDEDTAVGTIELDRPERMNSLNLEMIDEISVAVDQLSEDDDVRAIVLRGAGDRAFCAGADVNEIIVNSDAQEGTAISRTGQETFGKLKECPKPVVAAIDGFTFGGGMELAACADVRIATEGSALGQPEIDLGIIPGWGGTQRLRRIVGEGRAREIILTGDHYDAETMAEYGYLNEVVAEDEFDSFVEDYAADLASGPPIAYEYAKRALLAGQDDVEAGLEIEAQAFGQLVDTEDALEGVSAFNSDEEPDFQGQ